MTQFAQKLMIYLRSGQSIEVMFNAEKAEVLNPQIEDFLRALSDKEKKGGNYLFQGARVVMVRLDEVAAADVLSFTKKEEQKEAA